MPTEREITERLTALLANSQEPSLEGMVAMGVAVVLKRQEEHYEYTRLAAHNGLIDVIYDITAFQDKYQQGYNGPPRQLPPEYKWRIDFFEEESIREYQEAVADGDLVKQFDALLDTMFITLGTMIIQGFPIAQGWRELCRSNMTKECVPLGQGKFGATVHKGKDFSPIRLEEILYPLIDRGWIEPRIDDLDWMPEPFTLKLREGASGQLDDYSVL